MNKDENTDWISKDNSTFKMVNGNPVKIEEKTKSYANYIIMFLVVITVVVSAMAMSISASKTSSEIVKDHNDEVKAKQEQTITPSPASTPTIWTEGQLQEMVNAFNKVQSSNNYSILYDGCTVEKLPNGGDKLIVYVTDKFTLLSENEKKLYVEQNFKLWAGMAGSRQVKVNYDYFEIEMLRKGTIKRLATWDSLSGVSIK